MAGIEDPDVVDLITVAQSGEYALIMVAEAPWTDTPEQLSQLLHEINTYLAFATEGGLASAYPESIGKPLRFQLNCLYPATDAVHQVIGHVRPRLGERGIRFEVTSLA
jgi:hypothetical protein